jgi:predicted AAA+ superfamily ATPase
VFQYWLFGGYPKVVLTPDPKQKIVYLKEIYTSVLEKDIKYLLKEKEILNLSKVLKQIAGKI